MNQGIKVHVKYGDKEINLEVDQVDEYQKVYIIHNVFKAIGIDTDRWPAIKKLQR